MANYYVRSGAGGAGTGADWANAYTTLTAALSGKTNADVLWVADDHAESTVGAVTLTCPSSPGMKILGVNTHVTEPPTTLNSTPAATVAVGASSNALAIAGFAYIYGITFQGATNNSVSSTMTIASASNPHGLIFDNCKFDLRSGNASGDLLVNQAANSGDDDSYVAMLNCQLKTSAVGQAIIIRQGRLNIQNLSLDAAGSIPTSIFTLANACNGTALIEGCDFSGRAATNLLDYGFACAYDVLFRNCKLPASIVVATGTNPGPGGPIATMVNCDSGDTNYRYAKHSYAGTVTQETTIKRTGGASDGTTGVSYKLVSNANALYPTTTVESPDIIIWNDTTGSSKTATIEIVHDSQGAGSGSNFQNDEIWMTLQYLGNGSTPISTIDDNAVADVMTAAANQTTSAATWTTTGLTSPVTQKLQITFTPQEKGPVIAKVFLAKASKTVYIDPLITIS